MLEDTETYVPKIIRNILSFWYVFNQLSQPYQSFVGLIIGLLYGMAAKATPGLIGYDLFFPPEWLTWVCEKCFNKAVATKIDARRREDQERNQVEENVRVVQ